MINKFVLINLKTNQTTEYKSIRNIADDLNLEYHQARSIFLQSSNPKKNLHQYIKELCDDYKIIYNPKFYKTNL